MISYVNSYSFNGHMLCPSILIRRWFQPTVMGISYVNSCCFLIVICYALLFSSSLVSTNRYGHFMLFF